MFFFLSKTLGLLVAPMSLCVTLLGVALALRLLRRRPRLQRILTLTALIQLYLFSTRLGASGLLRTLEGDGAPPAAPAVSPAAIVMLTGMASPRAGGGFDLGDPSDRFVEALRLARRYPQAKLILSGGTSALIDNRYREAEVLGRLARELGVPPAQLVVESRSRNTHENAVETARLLRDQPPRGPVLLVTSAFHMPRALRCFRKAGLAPTPWPVDQRSTPFDLKSLLPDATSLRDSELALREIWGLLAYKVAGYL